MSFREKSAWITLAALILFAGMFVVHFPWPFILTPEPGPQLYTLFTRSIIWFIGILTVAHIVVAIWSPREVMVPKDERERLIAIRSTAISAYVYAGLSLASLFTIHHGANAIGVSILVFWSLVAAEVVNYALRVFFYRRGF